MRTFIVLDCSTRPAECNPSFSPMHPSARIRNLAAIAMLREYAAPAVREQRALWSLALAERVELRGS